MSRAFIHKPPLIIVLGPTASGKSELSIKLARKFNGEIVSADSRQIYKEMDIGTNKIKNAKIKNQKLYISNKIPHHLIDIVYPNQNFTLAQYKKLAIKTIKEIQPRNKLPILCGGTGLYIKAVVDNLQIPKVKPDLKLRQKIEKEIKEKGLERVYQKLLGLDPAAKNFIEPKNPRRIIRALEVCLLTGRPFSKQRKKGRRLFNTLQIGLKRSKEKLEQRIIKRTKKMIGTGLEKEVKKLVEKYGWTPALQSIGYQEWKDYFNKKINKQEVEKLISRRTIQFAKRQMTWFKKDAKVKWLKNYKEAEKLVKGFLKKN